MERPTSDQTLMEIAVAFAKRSTCLRRKVGAVIGKGGRVLSSGYVGAPPGMPHCTPDICNPSQPCLRTIHAEANAIAWAARCGIETFGTTLYTTVSPCNDCAKLIIAAGITRIVYLETYRDLRPLLLLQEAGVQLFPPLFPVHA